MDRGKKLSSFLSAAAAERSFSFVGTEDYVAPEVVRGDGHEIAVDWWALGVLVYEMSHGRTPFRGRSRKETFRNVLLREPGFTADAWRRWPVCVPTDPPSSRFRRLDAGCCAQLRKPNRQPIAEAQQKKLERASPGTESSRQKQKRSSRQEEKLERVRPSTGGPGLGCARAHSDPLVGLPLC